MNAEHFCTISKDDFIEETNGFVVTGKKIYYKCADHSALAQPSPEPYRRLVGRCCDLVLEAASIETPHGLLTELVCYNQNTWTSSRLMITEHCYIVTASLSPDYSCLLYTTLSINPRNPGTFSPENYETILIDLRVPQDSIRFVLWSGKDYQRTYFFPDYTIDKIHFVLFIEGNEMRYYVKKRPQLERPIDEKKELSVFSRPQQDFTFPGVVWFDTDEDRLFYISYKKKINTYLFTALRFSINTEFEQIFQTTLHSFFYPPTPFPHVPLPSDFSFLSGTRNLHLRLQLLRIREENYVLVQQHFVKPPTFPDDSLFTAAESRLRQKEEVYKTVRRDEDILEQKSHHALQLLYKVLDIPGGVMDSQSSSSLGSFFPLETSLLQTSNQFYIENAIYLSVFVFQINATKTINLFIPLQSFRQFRAKQKIVKEQLRKEKARLLGKDDEVSSDQSQLTKKEPKAKALTQRPVPPPPLRTTTTPSRSKAQFSTSTPSTNNQNVDPAHTEKVMSLLRNDSVVITTQSDLLLFTRPNECVALLDCAPQHNPLPLLVVPLPDDDLSSQSFSSPFTISPIQVHFIPPAPSLGTSQNGGIADPIFKNINNNPQNGPDTEIHPPNLSFHHLPFHLPPSFPTLLHHHSLFAPFLSSIGLIHSKIFTRSFKNPAPPNPTLQDRPEKLGYLERRRQKQKSEMEQVRLTSYPHTVARAIALLFPEMERNTPLPPPPSLKSYQTPFTFHQETITALSLQDILDESSRPETVIRRSTKNHSVFLTFTPQEYLYRRNSPLNYSVDSIRHAQYDVPFVMNSATGEIIFLYVDWQKLVTLLNPIRPQDMVALIHIAVVHNHDLDFARNLLLHCALVNPSLLTAAVIHEILISVPFSALLTKSSTTLKDIRSVMMSTISYIPELPQIAQAVEEGVLRTFGMAGGGRQQVSTNFGLKLMLDGMLAGSEQVLLKENEPFVLTPSLLLSPFLQKYNTKNMIFDFSLMYKGDLYVERELDLTEKERDRARRRRIRMYRSQLIQVASEQGRNTKLFRDELDEVLPLPASPCTLIPKGVVSQSETATFVTTILFLMSKFSAPYTTHPLRVIKAVNQNTFSLLSDYSTLLTSGPLNAQSLSRLQRMAITGKAREQSNAEHCNTGYLSPLHHRILERMPDVVFTSPSLPYIAFTKLPDQKSNNLSSAAVSTSTYIRHKLRTSSKTMRDGEEDSLSVGTSDSSVESDEIVFYEDSDLEKKNRAMSKPKPKAKDLRGAKDPAAYAKQLAMRPPSVRMNQNEPRPRSNQFPPRHASVQIPKAKGIVMSPKVNVSSFIPIVQKQSPAEPNHPPSRKSSHNPLAQSSTKRLPDQANEDDGYSESALDASSSDLDADDDEFGDEPISHLGEDDAEDAEPNPENDGALNDEGPDPATQNASDQQMNVGGTLPNSHLVAMKVNRTPIRTPSTRMVALHRDRREHALLMLPPHLRSSEVYRREQTMQTAQFFFHVDIIAQCLFSSLSYRSIEDLQRPTASDSASAKVLTPAQIIRRNENTRANPYLAIAPPINHAATLKISYQSLLKLLQSFCRQYSQHNLCLYPIHVEFTPNPAYPIVRRQSTASHASTCTHDTSFSSIHTEDLNAETDQDWTTQTVLPTHLCLQFVKRVQEEYPPRQVTLTRHRLYMLSKYLLSVDELGFNVPNQVQTEIPRYLTDWTRHSQSLVLQMVRRGVMATSCDQYSLYLRRRDHEDGAPIRDPATKYMKFRILSSTSLDDPVLDLSVFVRRKQKQRS